MVMKLTIVGRISDGFPLAQSPRYSIQQNPNFSNYIQQADFLLQQISTGALPFSDQFIVPVDHHSFNCLVEKGVFFITLCDSSYPTKLAFCYLQDLRQEFDKFDLSYIQTFTTPYSFIKFDGLISKIRKQYVDTRTQANLSKMNDANRQHNPSIVTESITQLVERKRRLEILERLVQAPQNVSPIWGSKRLEVIALKWTPITIIIIVASVLFWATLILKDDFV